MVAAVTISLTVFGGYSYIVFLAGYGYRDHQLIKSHIGYKNVLVLQKLTNTRFIMLPEYMKKQDSQLCPGSTVDWQEGDLLDDWDFEQMHGCKRVISYHKHLKGDTLNASIQIR